MEYSMPSIQLLMFVISWMIVANASMKLRMAEVVLLRTVKLVWRVVFVQSMMSVRRIEDPGGKTLKVKDYEGHLVQPLPDIGKRLDALPTLSLRQDDVIVAGYPKAGNHWIFALCWRLLTGSFSTNEYNLHEYFLESRGDRYLSNHPSPRVLGTHLSPPVLSRAKQLFSSGCKVVYVLRDPRDIAVSYYHMSYNVTSLYDYGGEWKDFFELFLRGDVSSGSWFDHVLSWEQFKADHPELPIHFVFYEDLLKDLNGEIQKLASFLEVDRDESFLQQLYEASQFTAMKKHHDDNISTGHKNAYRKGSGYSMFRKGVAGGWKTTFTVEQSDRLDAVFAERMKDSKLDFPFKSKPQL